MVSMGIDLSATAPARPFNVRAFAPETPISRSAISSSLISFLALIVPLQRSTKRP